MGRATPAASAADYIVIISIHALRGEGDLITRLTIYRTRISIHALRGEGDDVAAITFNALTAFQSTPSVGRATWVKDNSGEYTKEISIHALRGEGDREKTDFFNSIKYFNPRPPWGGRHMTTAWKKRDKTNFNPRPPWGGRRLNSPTRNAI